MSCFLSIIRSLLLLFQLSTYCISQKCTKKGDTQICLFTIPAEPITFFTNIKLLGESLETCLNHFGAFNWDVAIYCEELQFCGLGLDLTLDYRSRWERKRFSPAENICQVIVNKKEASCEETISNIQRAGLLSS